jgi:hypothetical protein
MTTLLVFLMKARNGSGAPCSLTAMSNVFITSSGCRSSTAQLARPGPIFPENQIPMPELRHLLRFLGSDLLVCLSERRQCPSIFKGFSGFRFPGFGVHTFIEEDTTPGTLHRVTWHANTPVVRVGSIPVYSTRGVSYSLPSLTFYELINGSTPESHLVFY